MTVASGKEALDRSLPGTVRASQRVELAFQVEGTINQLRAQEGQSVKKGDLLATMAQADLQSSEAALDKAKLRLTYTYLNAPFSWIV